MGQDAQEADANEAAGNGQAPAASAAAAAAPPSASAEVQAAAVQRTGYQGFGSFHSENVEEMAADPAWQPPPNPCEQARDAAGLAALAESGAPFGEAWRHQFLVDFDRWTFVNHGAFGAALKCAHLEAEAWRRRCESQPLRFLDRELFAQLVRVMRELAACVGCRPRDLALLPNATTGLNTVIQSLRGRVGPGDALFSLDIGYGSVKRMLQVACEQTGAQHVQLEVQFPLDSPQDLVSQVASALPANARFAVFDAVTSNTAVVLPIRELVQLCHSRGVEVLIDGAHAPGMLPLDLEELGADFFVANCHKWLCAPRGSAFLHVPASHQPRIRPLIVSHGYGSGFVSEFIWDGCRDYAPLLAVSAALDVWRRLGPEAVRAHLSGLLAAAVAALAEAWGTGTLVPLSMCGFMALVELPASCTAATQAAASTPPAVDSSAGGGAGQPPTQPAAGLATSADAKWVQDSLHYGHAVECPVKCIHGRLFVRISAHIYNELGDYRRLAAAVLSIAGHAQQDGGGGGGT